MTFICYSGAETKESALIHFANVLNKFFPNQSEGKIFLHLPSHLVQVSDIGLSDVLKEMKIDVDANSKQAASLNTLYFNSTIISKNTCSEDLPKSKDFVVVPFFQIDDYNFLSCLESIRKCNIVCLLDDDEETVKKISCNNQILDLTSDVF